MSVSEHAAEYFARETGRTPDEVWSAPGRVNLIGEHTDYNDGFVLPFAIHNRTAAAVSARDDDVVRVVSEVEQAPVEVSLANLDAAIAAGGLDWAAYPLGVAWALRAAAPGARPGGADIAITSDVPLGAGLSSSAAIEGAVASALNALWSADLDATALARVGRTAENDAVGAPTGIMDQMASMRGEADSAIFLDCRSLEAEPVALGFDAAGLEILVVDTLVRHAHSTGGYRERRESCERGAAALGVSSLRDVSVDDLPRAAAVLDDETFRRVRHVVTENQRVLDTVAALRAGNLSPVGELLTASHVSMRHDFEISVPELDLAVEAALSAGALGARMTGGGFGGSAIALIDRSRVSSAIEKIRERFADAGAAAPHTFTVTPAQGARRDA